MNDDWIPKEAKDRMAAREANDWSSLCHDCGIDAWGFDEDGTEVTEQFYVSNALWDLGAPDDDVFRWEHDGALLGQGRFILCIGCFERRIGRTLTKEDLDGDGDPPENASRRYRDRWRATISNPVTE